MGKCKFIAMSCLILGALAHRCWPASFDCQSAHLSAVEKGVCGNQTLSDLDSKLEAFYATVKANASSTQAAELVEAQRGWIKRRNQCLDYSCVLEAYRTRIVELSPTTAAGEAADISAGGPPTSKTVAKEIAEFSEVPKDSFFVGGIEFNFDGSELLTSPLVAQGDTHVWHWRDEPKLLNRALWPTPCPGGEAALNSCATTRNLLAASADGSLWAFARAPLGAEGRHKAIRIFNSQTGIVVHDFFESHGNDGAMAIAFSPDGRLFVQAVWRGSGSSNELLVYRTDTWAQVQSLLTRPFTPRALAINPDSKQAAVAGELWTPNPHPQILIVDLKNGTVTKTIDHPFPDGNQVHSLAWSCDGTSLFAGSLVYKGPIRPDVVKIFDPETGTQIRAESADAANVTTMRCSPDSRYFVEAAINDSVRIWDGRHTTLLQTIEVRKGPANVFFGISRDSRYLAIADMGHISVWEFL